MSTRASIAVLFTAFFVVAGLYLWMTRVDRIESPLPTPNAANRSEAHSAKNAADPLNFTTEHSSPGLVTLNGNGAVAAETSVKPEPPTSLRGFWEMSLSTQTSVVTSLQGEIHWEEAVRRFMRLAIQDRSLAPITRNNIANGLLHQRPIDENLYRLFADMAKDPREGEVWRDYSVQFLAQTIPEHEAEPDKVANLLSEFMRHGVGTQPATAALHLQQLSDDGLVQLPPDFRSDLSAIATNEQQPEGNRLSALALLAQRHEALALPLARRALKEGSPGMRRVGAGALGLVGKDEEDLLLLNEALSDSDQGVIRAANSSKQLLLNKLNKIETK